MSHCYFGCSYNERTRSKISSYLTICASVKNVWVILYFLLVFVVLYGKTKLQNTISAMEKELGHVMILHNIVRCRGG